MRSRPLATLILLLAGGGLLAQDRPPESQNVEFRFGGSAVAVPRVGSRIEIIPVLAMLGADASYSAAAQSYGVVYGETFVQFALDRRYILVNGVLQEAPDPPVASPAGVAASIAFLERALLAPMGFHLEPTATGWQILPGARVADPVSVRPAAADFAATTTLVLTLDRPAAAAVDAAEDGALVVRFADASPTVDPTVTLRSRRIRGLESRGQELVVEAAVGIGLLSWHLLDGPPRVILELGQRRPTPSPEPVQVVERTGPPPIVIDPGHGGDDTGATAPSGMMEKDLTLAIARRLRQILSARGHSVRLTRDGDEARALSDRTALANRLEATVFVSLHANASTLAAVRGAETYYMSLDSSATDEHAAATAALENRPVGEEAGSSAIDLILWDLAQAAVLNESARLALAVQERLNALLGLRDRGVKQAPFVVLTGATMPAILVEVGFLSNPAEAIQLESADQQTRLAEAIALGIESYVGPP